MFVGEQRFVEEFVRQFMEFFGGGAFDKPIVHEAQDQYDVKQTRVMPEDIAYAQEQLVEFEEENPIEEEPVIEPEEDESQIKISESSKSSIDSDMGDLIKEEEKEVIEGFNQKKKKKNGGNFFLDEFTMKEEPKEDENRVKPLMKINKEFDAFDFSGSGDQNSQFGNSKGFEKNEEKALEILSQMDKSNKSIDLQYDAKSRANPKKRADVNIMNASQESFKNLSVASNNSNKNNLSNFFSKGKGINLEDEFEEKRQYRY